VAVSYLPLMDLPRMPCRPRVPIRACTRIPFRDVCLRPSRRQELEGLKTHFESSSLPKIRSPYSRGSWVVPNPLCCPTGGARFPAPAAETAATAEAARPAGATRAAEAAVTAHPVLRREFTFSDRLACRRSSPAGHDASSQTSSGCRTKLARGTWSYLFRCCFVRYGRLGCLRPKQRERPLTPVPATLCKVA
jgi:hypothetical protein